VASTLDGQGADALDGMLDGHGVVGDAAAEGAAADSARAGGLGAGTRLPRARPPTARGLAG
jgi:hypothetical protein